MFNFLKKTNIVTSDSTGKKTKFYSSRKVKKWVKKQVKKSGEIYIIDKIAKHG